MGCIDLESVIISNNVTSIGSLAFVDCRKLSSVTVPNSVTSIGESAFSRCENLTSIILPNSIKSLSNNLFSSCVKLISVTFSNELESIGDGSFSACANLSSIIIPKSVKSIGAWAFYQCKGLTKVYCHALTPPNASYNAFENIDFVNCTLYIPKGCYTNYSLNQGWSNFIYISEELITSLKKEPISNLNVYSEEGSIIIDGEKPGENIEIYNVSGALLHSFKTTNNVVKINVMPNNFYIVRTKKKTFKVYL